ncbi:uncharacterized protein LOC121627660 [Chelmon rostratus]|uniref:uncharacterized protein LOC121627660 n=1 Tax=Chelmon rostratus TaxID=109905 RepID=UPI001BE6D874|nr:uncharacterized protein LOC121627660 [Chelmon rostratus]
MACTTQSALNYVITARRHLVRELKNLSVIVENLYQRGVFSDEEVSKIKAEGDDYDKSRKILDSVTKKGEDACYEFLRIIDITRKRALDRPPLLPEKRSVASNEANRFDLHHWISCFSFKEDAQMDLNYFLGPRPCHRYQAKLKSKAQKMSDTFWNESKRVFEENRKPDVSYASLVLDTQGSISPSKIKTFKSKKSKMSRSKKMKTYVPEDRPEMSPSDLLKTDRDMLLVGEPGIGKTALIHEVLRLWAETHNNELDYMFYFDVREKSHITTVRSWEDLLFSEFSEPDDGKEEVLRDIKDYSDNVTIIFDGITDLSSSVVQKLVKESLPNAKVILTCRPDDEDEDFFSGDFLRVEVKGFSGQTIKTYFSVMLGEEREKVLSNLELLTLCHVPMYALMVAACFSSEATEGSPQPRSITEIYINIVRECLRNSNKIKIRHLNSFISNKRQEILSLAEAAFHATERKTVNLTGLASEDSCVLCFLKPLLIKAAPTEAITMYAFLHYTMQEFFAALWLLKNPDRIKNVLQQEMKHMKHLIPFMCRLLTDKTPSLMKCLIPAQELEGTSKWFLEEMINTFFCWSKRDQADAEDSGLDVDILFLCQCLYESQRPEACVYFLNKLNHSVDLSGQSLESYPCCAVAYVIAQSKGRILLNLADVTVSEQGMRQLFGCLQNVEWRDPLPQQLWEIFLLSEGQMDYASLLGLDGNQLHLPVDGKRRLFERAGKVIQKITTQVNVFLHLKECTHVSQSLCAFLSEALPHISRLRFSPRSGVSGHITFLVNLFCAAAEREQQRGEKMLELLSSVCSYETIPLHHLYPHQTLHCDFLLDLFSRVKDCETETGLSLLPSLQPVFQAAPAGWVIDLSRRKTSTLLEVLKLQSEKKQVELTGCSDEESEVSSFLDCLPHISQLRVGFQSGLSDGVDFLVNLFCAAAEREQQRGEKMLELLSSVCSSETIPLHHLYPHQTLHCDFLLDLFSRVKDCETETGLSLLPSLQPVFQAAPAGWVIDLSRRKTSTLLEVLKLQSEKKRVKLTGCSDEESEVSSFLDCLPHISQLRFSPRSGNSGRIKFLVNLFCAAAEREQQRGEKMLELLSSVWSYKTIPFDYLYPHQTLHCEFLLDLFSRVKDRETETGLSLLPSLQPVFQAAPAGWVINLSWRETSTLLEVLKLQSEKKPVKLTGGSDEESEVSSFLDCLPHISQLRFSPRSGVSGHITFLVNLFCAAAEREQLTGEKMLELLSSVWSYETFPFDDLDDEDDELLCYFLLDLFSRVKDCETETGLSLLPSLQPVFQAAPAVWVINLSRRETSTLLEVLKLQSEKKPVELTGCSDEESEVSSFLDCLPHISQLRVGFWSGLSDDVKFLVNLFCAAAEREQQRGEKMLELLSSVCSYETFPFDDLDDDDDVQLQCDFLLDLFSRVKDRETETGLSLLPSLQPVFQAAPAVWVINLSWRETSTLLEVLKLQSEKKPVKLTGGSDEESEVSSFLDCLPHISQLRFSPRSRVSDGVDFLVNLFCAAAEREQLTGEKMLELLSSVCSHKTFPFDYLDDDDELQCDFLLDLFSRVKDCETETGLSLLPSLQPVFQEVPAGWVINLSERKTSTLLEVLKLQSEKKQVELTGCSDEESEVSSFLDCLPHISQLRGACGALALILNCSEGLKELDLSHCELPDQLLFTLIPHLPKVQDLDLSHNKITDASTSVLLQLVATNPSIKAVRLFGNDIVDRTPFQTNKWFEIW